MGDSAYSSLRSSPALIPELPEYDYDVYVFYADEDSDTVCKFIEFMETPRYKLSMYYRGGDPLDELNGDIEAIKHKCRRMVAFLTPSFLESPSFQLLAKLAETFTPDECEKYINPVLLSPCEVPSFLCTTNMADFTKEGLQGRMWERLVVSLIPGHKLSNFVHILSKVPLRVEEFPPVVNGKITEVPKFNLDLTSQVEELDSTAMFKK